MFPGTSKSALQSLTKLQEDIKRSLEQIGYEQGSSMFEELNFPDYNDPRDSEFVRDQLINVIQTLDKISEDIMYLNQPVQSNGYLVKRSNGRYFLNDLELSSGVLVEILDDDFEWRLTRIEHSGDYYAVALGKSIALDNRKCRIRV